MILLQLRLFLILACTPACAAAAHGVLPQVQSAAADITGNWQGTLQLQGDATYPGPALRIVLEISKASDGTLTALNYSIDQGWQPMATDHVTLQDHTFRYAIPSIGGGYEGQLSPDGNSIDGKWAQSLPLRFVRATKEAAWEIPQPPAPLKPMTDTDPSFQVATIKPSDPTQHDKYFRVTGRTYATHGTSLTDLIQVAYGLNPRQIINAPVWAREDRFDLVAIPDAPGEPNAGQWLTMMQKLLADRFGLVFHRDKQQLSSYVIARAPGGPRNLTPSASGSPLPGLEFNTVPGGVLLPARNATLGQFAQMLQQAVLDRPVVDRTGLTGRFDFHLTFLPNETQFNGHPPITTPAADASPAPDLADALRQQLGLNLTVEKIPTDVLVLDHLQKPSAN